MITVFIKFQIQDNVTEIFICTLVSGAASQYLDGFLESHSQNCDVILAFILTYCDALPLFYVILVDKTHDVVNKCT